MRSRAFHFVIFDLTYCYDYIPDSPDVPSQAYSRLPKRYRKTSSHPYACPGNPVKSYPTRPDECSPIDTPRRHTPSPSSSSKHSDSRSNASLSPRVDSPVASVTSEGLEDGSDTAEDTSAEIIDLPPVKNEPEPAWSQGIHCRLETKELWDKFHDLGTEMIITKTGR